MALLLATLLLYHLTALSSTVFCYVVFSIFLGVPFLSPRAYNIINLSTNKEQTMEYLIISESKLKVTLDSDELEKRSLEASALDYADPDAKKLFCDILHKAKEDHGFDTSGYRVLLQLYPSKDGGCELFITKLGALDSEKNAEPTYNKKNSLQKKKKSERAFRFERLSHLINVCKRLYESGEDISASVFVDEDGIWFLILNFEDSICDDLYDMLPICEFSFISEYGRAEDPSVLSLYLGEHAKKICDKDALKLFCRL